jgi:hypothetical protein
MNRLLQVFLLAAAILVPVGRAGAANPVGDWRFDEGAGQVVHDATGHGILGMLGASAASDARDPAWADGLFGKALHFDDGAQVTLAPDARLEPPTVSVTAWVRRLGSPGRWRYIVSKGGTGCFASSYGLYTGYDQGLAFYILGPHGAYVRSPEAGTEVWDGRWHHVAGTYDGTRVRAYVDGREVGAGTPTNDAIRYGLTSTGGFIGAYRGSCELDFDDGDIDEVEIWDGALSAAEIATAAARRPAGALPPGVVPTAPTWTPTVPPVTARGCPSIVVSHSALRLKRRTRLTIVARRLAGRTTIRVSGAGLDRRVHVRDGKPVRVSVRPRTRGLVRVQAVDAPGLVLRYRPGSARRGKLVKVSVRAAGLGRLNSIRVKISVPGTSRVVRVHRGQIARVEIRARRTGAVRVTPIQDCRQTLIRVR